MKIDSGYLIATKEERKELKEEFDKLTTIELQYQFWLNKFDLNYSFNFTNNIQEHTFKEFLIIPQNKKDIGELNRRIYADVAQAENWDKKTIVNKWEQAFKEKLKDSKNKEIVIHLELKKIDDFIGDLEAPLSYSRSKAPAKQPVKESASFNIKEGYKNYLLTGKNINWQSHLWSPQEIFDVKQGIEIAKYRELVKNYPIKKRNDDLEPISKLNGSQILLLLHDLGFCSDIDDDKLKAKIYKQFIPELKEETIRTTFPRIYDRYNKKSKDALIKFYQSINYNEKAYDLMPKPMKKNKFR